MQREVTEGPATRLARLTAALRASLGLVVNVALPQLCPSCREPVDGAGLCPACWAKLSFIAPPYCERLGIPFPFDGGPGLLSMEAIADPPAYNRARDHGGLDGTRGLRAAYRRPSPRSGAAALAPTMGAPVQPIGAAGPYHRQRERSNGLASGSEAGQGDAAAGRA